MKIQVVHMDYNNHSRKINAILSSSAGLIQQMVQIFGTFAYRTVFLYFLSKEYLGFEGLFSNILQLFSLAELGIGSAILYSMYKPFAAQDTQKISALIHFYSKVYHFLAVFVMLLGICFYPFIGMVINMSEVPSDVNLTVVYFLFVLRSVSSYLFVYKQSILTADQRNYIVSLSASALLLLSFAVRIVVLFLCRKFELVLLTDIVVSILFNWAFSIWITRKYSGIFRQKAVLPKEDKHVIYKNTAGLLCHKIGTVVVVSTDNIVLSKFVSLVAVGIYTNYATIVLAITGLVNRVLASMVPTITNYVISKTKEESYGVFKKFLFLNMWFSCFTSVCLYLLLNPFIELWLDRSFLLPQIAVTWICFQHYLQVSRITANNFVTACGLFMRDKIVPLIESVLNIVISVALAKAIGITGVFIGTCVSGLCTYFWREPYLVFKNYFKSGYWKYWVTQGLWLCITVALCFVGRLLISGIGNSLLGFVCKCIIAVVLPNAVLLLLTFRTKECRFFMDMGISFLRRRLHR